MFAASVKLRQVGPIVTASVWLAARSSQFWASSSATRARCGPRGYIRVGMRGDMMDGWGGATRPPSRSKCRRENPKRVFAIRSRPPCEGGRGMHRGLLRVVTTTPPPPPPLVVGLVGWFFVACLWRDPGWLVGWWIPELLLGGCVSANVERLPPEFPARGCWHPECACWCAGKSLARGAITRDWLRGRRCLWLIRWDARKGDDVLPADERRWACCQE